MSYRVFSRSPLVLVLVAFAFGCEETPADAYVEVGYNAMSVSGPEGFVPLADGDVLPVVLGTQGAWMVVGAVRTDAFVSAGWVTVRPSLHTDDGAVQTTFHLRRTLTIGPDGLAYVGNVFIVLGYDDPAEEREAVLSIALESEGGDVFERTVRVRLSGAGPEGSAAPRRSAPGRRPGS